MRVFDAAGRVKTHTLSADHERDYWQMKAASLDVAAYTYTIGASWSVTVPADKAYYLASLWQGRMGSAGGHMFKRDLRDPMPMPAGMNIQANGHNSACHIYYFDPSAVTYSDPKGVYHERLARLKTLMPSVVTATMASGQAQGTTATALFPTTFTNGLAMGAHAQDVAWACLGNVSNLINLNDEISDDHQLRFAASFMVPFVRATFPGVICRGGNVAGTATTTIAGTASIIYVPTPSDW
jgi:hypothetical protein